MLIEARKNTHTVIYDETANTFQLSITVKDIS